MASQIWSKPSHMSLQILFITNVPEREVVMGTLSWSISDHLAILFFVHKTSSDTQTLPVAIKMVQEIISRFAVFSTRMARQFKTPASLCRIHCQAILAFLMGRSQVLTGCARDYSVALRLHRCRRSLVGNEPAKPNQHSEVHRLPRLHSGAMWEWQISLDQLRNQHTVLCAPCFLTTTNFVHAAAWSSLRPRRHFASFTTIWMSQVESGSK